MTCKSVSQQRNRKSTASRILHGTIAVGIIVVAVLLKTHNPEEADFFPKCVFHSLTGLKCPGCGSQRALHNLFNGDFATAFRYNPLMFLLLPLVAWFAANCVSIALRGRSLPGIPTRRWVCWTAFGVLTGYWILRNIVGW